MREVNCAGAQPRQFVKLAGARALRDVPTPLPCCQVSRSPRPPRRAAWISPRPAVRGWIGAQLMLLILTHSPGAWLKPRPGLGSQVWPFATSLHLSPRAALGPRRCHPRRPAALIHSRRPRRPIALVVAALDASTPPPSRPRRRRPCRAGHAGSNGVPGFACE
jgi:hypothetical protein